MNPSYTIRRQISDTRWEYLKGDNWKHGQKWRTDTREKAEVKLAWLPKSEKWEISCCGD